MLFPVGGTWGGRKGNSDSARDLSRLLSAKSGPGLLVGVFLIWAVYFCGFGEPGVDVSLF